MLNRRRVEVDRRKVEREERISLIIKARKQEREAKRKKIFYIRTEEEKIKRLREEEEARKREGIHINCYFLTNQLYSFVPQALYERVGVRFLLYLEF